MNAVTVFDAETGEATTREWTPEELTELASYPPSPFPEPAKVLYSVELWTRMTDAEAEEVLAEMAVQPARTRKIFEAANSYRSDHELWPLLVQIATALFGEERAAQILAPSQQ